MHAKLALISSALFILLTLPAQGQPVESIFPYTLQVASFPEAKLAERYAENLSRAGQSVGLGTVELPGLGIWTRVYVGSFKTASAARYHGDALLGQNLISEYIVKTVRELQALGRPRTTNPKSPARESNAPAAGRPAPAELAKTVAARTTDGSRGAGGAAMPPASTKLRPPLTAPQRRSANAAANRQAPQSRGMGEQLAGLYFPLPAVLVKLPVAGDLELPLAPAVDAQRVPQLDPAYLAFNLIAGDHGGRGGLWVSGDCQEALARLRYILGDKSELIYLGEDGVVRINRKLLAEAAGVDQVSAEEAPLRLAQYIFDNEGLLLLVQMIEGSPRYLLHIGRRGPVLGGVIDIVGGVNLDNNYDSRINPYRRGGRKLDIERPPKGFDAMVAINPDARWFNLRSNEFVSAGQITFHELAEAHAKIVLNLDYLEQDGRPGAHDIALDREERLKAQRPDDNVVLTLGSNRLFKSEEEVRSFYTQTGSAGSHQE
jgi:SPOR domain